jgi:hypothetical protein
MSGVQERDRAVRLKLRSYSNGRPNHDVVFDTGNAAGSFYKCTERAVLVFTIDKSPELNDAVVDSEVNIILVEPAVGVDAIAQHPV